MTTKAELVDRLAEELELPKAELERTINALLEAIGEVLVEEGRLELRDFGVLAVATRKAHTGTHPRTGEPLEIPPVRYVTFRTGKALSERLNPTSTP